MWRLLAAFPLALVCVLLLFLFMAKLSQPNDSTILSKTKHYSIAITKQKAQVMPLPKIDLPLNNEQATALSDIKTVLAIKPLFLKNMSDIPLIGISELDINFSLTQIALPQPEQGIDKIKPFEMNHQTAIALTKVEPIYPIKALKRGIEGYVIMTFMVDKKGRPQNIDVIEAKPKRIFEKAAVAAVKKWRYRADTLQSADQKQQVKMEFLLDE